MPVEPLGRIKGHAPSPPYPLSHKGRGGVRLSRVRSPLGNATTGKEVKIGER
jgi:hypothetical protein